jgi:two-component system cell cycle sensor histidine kinase/response regulator CckA
VAVDLDEIAAEVIELTRARWQNEAGLQGVTFDVQLTPGAIPGVLGEPTALREVLVNLVLNASTPCPRASRFGSRRG